MLKVRSIADCCDAVKAAVGVRATGICVDKRASFYFEYQQDNPEAVKGLFLVVAVGAVAGDIGGIMGRTLRSL